jgi:hypothetical protein
VWLLASDLPAIVIVVAMTVFVVVVVIGMHVWGAIQDGRQEKAFRESRRTPPPR